MCNASDSSVACFKCVKVNDYLADCKKSTSCFLYKDKFNRKESTNFDAGSGSCNVFRSALEKAKKTKARTEGEVKP